MVVMWRFERRAFYISLLSAQRSWNEFDPQSTNTSCTLFKFKHYLRGCTKSGKKLLILYAKQPMEYRRGPTPDEKFHWGKGLFTLVKVIPSKHSSSLSFTSISPAPQYTEGNTTKIGTPNLNLLSFDPSRDCWYKSSLTFIFNKYHAPAASIVASRADGILSRHL